MSQTKGVTDTSLAPVIDVSELDDQHYKTYMSKSLKTAIKRLAVHQHISESELGRRFFMEGLKTHYGELKLINSAAGGFDVSAANDPHTGSETV